MVSLRFRDHLEFHRQVLRVAVVAVTAFVLPVLAGWPAPGSWAQALVAAAAAVLIGLAVTPPRPGRWGAGLLRGLLAGGAGLAASLALGAGHARLAAAALGLCAGALAARRQPWPRRGLTVGAFGLSFALGALVAAALPRHEALADLPAPAVALVAGVAFGLVAALGALGLHLYLHRDAVAEAYAQVKDGLGGEVGEIVTASLTTYRHVGRELASRDAPAPAGLAPAVERLVLGILHLARRLVTIDRETHAISTDALTRRLESLEERIAQTADPVALEQYQLARGAVVAQLAYLRDIGAGRERILARMHHDLAGLERLRLALVNHRSADAQRLSAEVQPILDDLRDLGEEFDLAAEAMGEAEAAARPAEPAPEPAEA